MNNATRLIVFTVGLVFLFVVSLAAGAAFGPEPDADTPPAEQHTTDHTEPGE